MGKKSSQNPNLKKQKTLGKYENTLNKSLEKQKEHEISMLHNEL